LSPSTTGDAVGGSGEVGGVSATGCAVIVGTGVGFGAGAVSVFSCNALISFSLLVILASWF
jgi:hypothetical protein